MNSAEIRKRILAENDECASRLKSGFDESGTLVVDIVSSPGAGKTSLLEETSRRLSQELGMGALVGDIATEMDAERLRSANLPAHQIVTGGACHLDARMVEEGLQHCAFLPVDLLFLENVGNLVCPASYALGEDFKVVLLSVTEGEDKPFKYPAIFSKAKVAVITKVDLLPQLSFDLERVEEQIRTLCRDVRILRVSAWSGEGMEEWCRLMQQEQARKRQTVGAN